METQIISYYPSKLQNQFVSIFGYSSRAIPSLEINGLGHLAKNLKEKIIYLSRTRKLKIPQRRFVVCVDIDDLELSKHNDLSWLEFPILLCFWHLSGILPINRLDDCIASGRINSSGGITHLPLDATILSQYEKMKETKSRNLKHITLEDHASSISTINSSLLLEHIPKLNFSNYYIESSSAIPS